MKFVNVLTLYKSQPCGVPSACWGILVPDLWCLCAMPVISWSSGAAGGTKNQHPATGTNTCEERQRQLHLSRKHNGQGKQGSPRCINSVWNLIWLPGKNTSAWDHSVTAPMLLLLLFSPFSKKQHGIPFYCSQIQFTPTSSMYVTFYILNIS